MATIYLAVGIDYSQIFNRPMIVWSPNQDEVQAEARKWLDNPTKRVEYIIIKTRGND